MGASKVIHMAGTTYAKVPGGVVKLQPTRSNRKAIRNARPKTKKAITKLVNRVINSRAESKMVTWFGGSTGTGTFADKTPVSQNQLISVNSTDILRLISPITVGSNDNQRTGDSIQPMSLIVNCRVMISPSSTGGTGWKEGYSYNLKAVAYCLQHVSYKTYVSLYANNDFSKLLKIGNSATTGFDGTYEASKLPVDTGYYRVLGKKVMTLRSAGSSNSGGSAVTPLEQGVNSNSAPFSHEWTWNLSNKLPKNLKYPENVEAPLPIPPGNDDPLNSAPFWCIGYYRMDGTVTSPQIFIQQQYVSKLTYKDM